MVEILLRRTVGGAAAENADDEEWRPCADFPSYDVSNLGRVKRMARATGARLYQVRALSPDHDGYLHVSLSEKNVQTDLKVQRLVAKAFLPKRPSPKHNIAHNDGNPANNRAGNLRWATQRENIADELKHGTLARGEKQGASKLTEAAVIEIRRLRTLSKPYERGGKSYKHIAEKFGVSKATIAAVVTRRYWGHVA